MASSRDENRQLHDENGDRRRIENRLLRAENGHLRAGYLQLSAENETLHTDN